MLTATSLCYLSFFLGTYSYACFCSLISPRNLDFILPFFFFLGFQVLGCFFVGVFMDLKGRIQSLKLASIIHSLALFFILASLTCEKHTKEALRTLGLDAVTTTLKQSLNTLQLFCRLFFLGGIGCLGFGVGGLLCSSTVIIAEYTYYRNRTLCLAWLFFTKGFALLLSQISVTLILMFLPPEFLFQDTLYWLMILQIGPSLFHFFSLFWNCYKVWFKGSTHTPSVKGSTDAETEDLLHQKSTCCLASPLPWNAYRSNIVLYLRVFYRNIVGTAFPWFIFAFCYFGDGLFNFFLVRHIKGVQTVLDECEFNLAVTSVAMLGYVITPFLVGKIIPKLLQILGFIILAFIYFGLALSLYSISHVSHENGISSYRGASILYECAARFFNFIPSLTLMIIPLEAFPTAFRGTFYALVMSISRIGTVFSLWITWKCVKQHSNNRAITLAYSTVATLCGAACTRALTPNIQPQNENLLTLDMYYSRRTENLQRFSRQSKIH